MKGLFTCVACKRLVRPRRRRPLDYPEILTVAYGCAGKCKTCYKHSVSDTTGLPAAEQAREARKIAYIKRGLDSYNARRNERLDRMERTYRLAA